MVDKSHKLVVFIPHEISLSCKADAAVLSMSLSEYVVAVLRERFGMIKLNKPVRAVETAPIRQSPGTVQLSRDTGSASRGAGGYVYDPLGLEVPPAKYDPDDPLGCFAKFDAQRGVS